MRKLNVTDGQTDGQTDGRGALQYLPSRASGAAGDKNNVLNTEMQNMTMSILVNAHFNNLLLEITELSRINILHKLHSYFTPVTPNRFSVIMVTHQTT